MMGEDREHFADYSELEHYVEDLQAEQAAHLPANLTSEQARIYRMAVLFHSTSPEVSKASQPHPDFIAALQESLLSISQEVKSPTQEEEIAQAHQADPSKSEDQQMVTQSPPSDTNAGTPPQHPRQARFISRRGLLAGGAVAASLAVGIGAGTMMDRSQPSQPAAYKQQELIPSGPTAWQFVAPLAQITTQATKFSTDALIYYVRLNDDNDQDKDMPDEPVIAVSATCTHMGCTLSWEDSNQQFRCPCHGGLFDEYGLPAKESPMRYLKPLPRLRTKIENGNIYVEVPASSSSLTNKSS